MQANAMGVFNAVMYTRGDTRGHFNTLKVEDGAGARLSPCAKCNTRTAAGRRISAISKDARNSVPSQGLDRVPSSRIFIKSNVTAPKDDASQNNYNSEKICTSCNLDPTPKTPPTRIYSCQCSPQI